MGNDIKEHLQFFLNKYLHLSRQFGGAKEGSCEALWRAASEDGGPGNWQGGEQTDRSRYLKVELPGPTYNRCMVS